MTCTCFSKPDQECKIHPLWDGPLRIAGRALVAVVAGLVLTAAAGAPQAVAAPGDLVYSDDWDQYGTVDESGNWIYWDDGRRPTHVDEEFPIVETVSQ